MTESITQTHNGSGDNILGDKIINQSMQAVDFVKVAYYNTPGKLDQKIVVKKIE